MLPKIRVGLSPVWGSMFIGLAVVDLWLYATTHSLVQLVVAGLMGLAGISHLTGALLVIEGNTVELKNPIGMTLKTFQIESPADLKIEGKKLWIRVGDEKKKISGLMANSAHWRALAAAIADAQRGTVSL